MPYSTPQVTPPHFQTLPSYSAHFLHSTPPAEQWKPSSSPTFSPNTPPLSGPTSPSSTGPQCTSPTTTSSTSSAAHASQPSFSTFSFQTSSKAQPHFYLLTISPSWLQTRTIHSRFTWESRGTSTRCTI